MILKWVGLSGDHDREKLLGMFEFCLSANIGRVQVQSEIVCLDPYEVNDGSIVS